MFFLEVRKDVRDLSDSDVDAEVDIDADVETEPRIDRTAGLKVLPIDVGSKGGINKDTKGEVVVGGLGYGFGATEGHNGWGVGCPEGKNVESVLFIKSYQNCQISVCSRLRLDVDNIHHSKNQQAVGGGSGQNE